MAAKRSASSSGGAWRVRSIVALYLAIVVGLPLLAAIAQLWGQPLAVIREKISLGVFVAFQRYVGKLQWPMEAFGLAANIFQRSMASQARIDEARGEPHAAAGPWTDRPAGYNGFAQLRPHPFAQP